MGLARMKNDLSSFYDLIATLVTRDREGPLSAREAQEILSDVMILPEDYENFVEEGEDHYTRNRLFLGRNMELLVLTWTQGQASKIHNHKGSVCCIRVLEGEALEIRFEKSKCGKLVPSSMETFSNGSITSSIDEDLHMVANTHPERLVTLHLYSPPLKKMEIFDKDETIFT